MANNLFHPDEGLRKVIGPPVMVEGEDKPVMMDLYVSPSGKLYAQPVPQVPIDQIGERSPSMRHQGVDQL